MSLRVQVIGWDYVNWSIDKDRENAKSILRGLPTLSLTESLWQAQVCLFVSYDQLRKKRFKWQRLLQRLGLKKIVAVVSNDVTKRPEKLELMTDYVNFWISPNSKISTFLQGKNLPYVQIPFYVNPDIFRVLKESKEKLAESLGIDYGQLKDKLVIGSFQRDSSLHDLSQPRPEKNPDLLLDILQRLPQDSYVLLLAGPRRHYVVKKCEALNIPHIYCGDSSYFEKRQDDIKANNLPPEKINKLYSLSDVVLITSSSESGPKAVLEGALTKTLTLSTPVGLASDFLHQDVLFEANQAPQVAEQLKRFSRDHAKFQGQIDYAYDRADSCMKLENMRKLYQELFSQF